MIKGKKGEVTDAIAVVIITTILATGLLVLAFVIPTITDGLNAGGLNSSTEGANAITQLRNFGTNTLQRGFLFVHFFLLVGVIITSFITRVNPAFIFLYIFFGIIAIILSVYMTNVYDILAASPTLAATAASQTFISIIMANLTRITLGIIALSILIVFSKGGSSQNL